MRKSLVGYTGFVGTNLCKKAKFDGLYNSKNINEAYKTTPDLLVYSGVPAEKFLANMNEEKDFEIIENAIKNIIKINPKKIVLISTIDIYDYCFDIDEDYETNENKLEPYGKNRYYLEKWVKNNFNDYLIVHLPALYGINMKKNYIYDFINIIPQLLTKEKYEELINKNSYIGKFYNLQENGFYKYTVINDLEEKQKLKECFIKLNFTALNFTDTRAKFQFYNLKYLWNHIELAMKNEINILNLATEPIQIAELYSYIKGDSFNNILNKSVPNYNFKTKHYKLFQGRSGYIFDREFVLKDLKNFIGDY